MSDSLSASRLPDLPVAGYSTRKQRALTDGMQELIRGFERDRRLMIEIVLGGHLKWRKVFVNALRAFNADDEFADAVFRYLVLLVGPNPEAQKAILQGLEQQQAQQRWDKRQSTARLFRKVNRELHENIRRELRTKRVKRHSVS